MDGFDKELAKVYFDLLLKGATEGENSRAANTALDNLLESIGGPKKAGINPLLLKQTKKLCARHEVRDILMELYRSDDSHTHPSCQNLAGAMRQAELIAEEQDVEMVRLEKSYVSATKLPNQNAEQWKRKPTEYRGAITPHPQINSTNSGPTMVRIEGCDLYTVILINPDMSRTEKPILRQGRCLYELSI